LFEIFLLGPALRFLESLEGDDQQEVRRLLDIICQDPFWDNRTKFPFPVPPATATLYESGRFRIVYHVLNNTRINVWGIGRSGENVPIH
jgi:hypothetical protein